MRTYVRYATHRVPRSATIDGNGVQYEYEYKAGRARQACPLYSYKATVRGGFGQALPRIIVPVKFGLTYVRTRRLRDFSIICHFRIYGCQTVRDYTTEGQPAATPPLPPPVLQARQRCKLKLGEGDTCMQSLHGEHVRNILPQRAAAPRYRRRKPDYRYRENIGTTS